MHTRSHQCVSMFSYGLFSSTLFLKRLYPFASISLFVSHLFFHLPVCHCVVLCAVAYRYRYNHIISAIWPHIRQTRNNGQYWNFRLERDSKRDGARRQMSNLLFRLFEIALKSVESTLYAEHFEYSRTECKCNNAAIRQIDKHVHADTHARGKKCTSTCTHKHTR